MMALRGEAEKEGEIGSKRRPKAQPCSCSTVIHYNARLLAIQCGFSRLPHTVVLLYGDVTNQHDLWQNHQHVT